MPKRSKSSKPKSDSSRNLLEEMDRELRAEWAESGFTVTERPEHASDTTRYKASLVPRRKTKPQLPPSESQPD